MQEGKTVKVLVVAPLGIGGVTNMMINIQKHLDREKVNFDYLVFHDRKEPCEDEVAAMGSKKLVASVDHVKFQPLRRLLRMNEIRKVCKQNKVKILHYNADSPADLTNIIAAKLGGVKYITIHSHNADFGNVGKGVRIVGNILRPLISKFCDNYYGCSDLAARFLFPKKIIESGNYSVLPNGIDLQKYDFDRSIREEVRKELNLENRFVIGHAGRFCEQKNHSYLLEIFQKVYEKDKSAALLLFGVGELVEPMKKKAAELGISDAVIFYGSSNQMERMWQAMDVFVMPSLHEGLPVTGIEAQASGLPCVFSDRITKEVDVTETSEFLSLETPPTVWADAILQYKGKERVSGVSVLAKANYDIQKTADTVSELYLKVAETID
ncbi:MAG: glycosyltransferase [Acutalibacteraceae bacterium]